MRILAYFGVCGVFCSVARVHANEACCRTTPFVCALVAGSWACQHLKLYGLPSIADEVQELVPVVVLTGNSYCTIRLDRLSCLLCLVTHRQTPRAEAISSLSFLSLVVWISLVNFKQGISLLKLVFSLYFLRISWVRSKSLVNLRFFLDKT